jgi:hypothetical protein
MSSKIFIFLLISNFKKIKFKIHIYIYIYKENYYFSFSHMLFCYISNVILCFCFYVNIFKTNKQKHEICYLLQFFLVTQSIYTHTHTHTHKIKSNIIVIISHI